MADIYAEFMRRATLKCFDRSRIIQVQRLPPGAPTLRTWREFEPRQIRAQALWDFMERSPLKFMIAAKYPAELYGRAIFDILTGRPFRELYINMSSSALFDKFRQDLAAHTEILNTGLDYSTSPPHMLIRTERFIIHLTSFTLRSHIQQVQPTHGFWLQNDRVVCSNGALIALKYGAVFIDPCCYNESWALQIADDFNGGMDLVAGALDQFEVPEDVAFDTVTISLGTSTGFTAVGLRKNDGWVTADFLRVAFIGRVPDEMCIPSVRDC